MNPQKTTIIAEAGVNHNGDFNLALEMIDVAADAGADVVKFQTFSTDHLVTSWAPKAQYQNRHTDHQESQYAMLKKLELSHDHFLLLQKQAKKRNIQFLSTPFDIQSALFLMDILQLPVIKISSGELTNAPLLLQIARKQADIILSTGMASLGEIEEALSVLAFGFLACSEKPSKNAFMQAYYSYAGQEILKKKVILLHCTSDYPASISHINLRAMNTLKISFDLRVGYSDHSMGVTIPIAAVALGACVVEKHFTLNRSMRGPDHKASLEPHELKNMVTAVRETEAALGYAVKISQPSECDTKKTARKSLVASTPIKKGDVFTEKNLSVQRPGTGITAIHFWDYMGCLSSRDYQSGELIYE